MKKIELSGLKNELKTARNVSRVAEQSKDIEMIVAAYTAEIATMRKHGLVPMLKITKHVDGQKMENMFSCSSFPGINPVCKARALDKKSVCYYCYAMAITANRWNLVFNTIWNYLILNSEMSEREINANAAAIVALGVRVFRIESFGDVASVRQAENYTRIINAADCVFFGVWTKNWNFWFSVFESIGKPENMALVLSSPVLNVPINIELLPAKYRGYVDKIFTVYDVPHYPLADVAQQCCNVQCAYCLKCYKKSGPVYINECVRTKTTDNKIAREIITAIRENAPELFQEIDGDFLDMVSRQVHREFGEILKVERDNRRIMDDDLPRAGMMGLQSIINTVNGTL